ncbi:MAG: acylphosphatase [Firmicutes bacterium]|nr:acylphosphatase [Bacillota bacterium]
MAALSRARIRVRGYVQGVGFRAFAQRKALSRGLRGYVKNLPDGSVEAVAEGPKDLIQDFIIDLRSGPSLSEVEEVNVTWEQYVGEFVSFRIH